MRLDAVTYFQFQGLPDEWRLENLALGDVNLLVGRNATGKSRTLSIILGLAKLLRGEQKPNMLSGDYDVTFSDDGKTFRYKLAYNELGVLSEELSIDSNVRLHRKKGEVGRIYAEKQGDKIEFAPPDTELAVVARRDSVQHPFLEPLYQWGNSVYAYLFGTTLGRERLALIGANLQTPVPPDFDPRDTNNAIGVFRKGELEFGDAYRAAVAADMVAIGFDVETVALGPLTSLRIQASVGQVVGFSVKERDRPTATDHADMSQGMFRALATIVQVNYVLRALRPSCILVDDIGEGLDFERSCALVDLLRNKAKSTEHLQLVMATNDRFVMNRVPLEEWTLLRREGAHSRVFNYANSKTEFEDFKFTGLSNFDFLATDYLGRKRQEK
jgi:energy-coupling factor transporter ATP-binding protein EcfA2